MISAKDFCAVYEQNPALQKFLCSMQKCIGFLLVLFFALMFLLLMAAHRKISVLCDKSIVIDCSRLRML